MSNRYLSFRSLAITLFVIAVSAFTASAQLTGVKNIPGDYADLAAAITDLNTQGVGSGGVVFNLLAGNPQTAPVGGYIIGGAGSPVLTTTNGSDTIVFQGNNNTITAPAGQTAGVLHDSIFELVGADWVTISGFTLAENAANTTTAAGTNNMTEFGVSLFYVTTTDGANNNTLEFLTIDLNRTYQNTFGIYANATHTSTTISTSATATGALGGNSGLTIRNNSITDVNMGIVVVGPTAAADHNSPITIGGGVGFGNTITNFGTTGTFSAYANVSGTVNGVLVRNAKNANVSYNSITSSAGGVTAGTLNGIQFPSFSNAPTGTFTQNVSNNTLTLQSGAATGAINGVNIGGTSASVTSVINVDNNNFVNFGHTVAASGTITFITQAGGHLTHSISGNLFNSPTVNTTGSVTFISSSTTVATGGTKTVSGHTVNGFNKTGAGGTVTFYTDNGSSPLNTTTNVTNNTFTNITVTGSTAVTGISDTDGGAPNKNVQNNTISNITGGLGTIIGITTNFDGGTTTISGNTVSNISNGAAITGILTGTSGSGGALTTNISQNTVHSFAGTGTGAAVLGISLGGTTGHIKNVTRNKIYNLESNNASGTVNGIAQTSVPTANISNNLIGDLRTTAANAANPLIGINITGGTTVTADFNTVYLSAGSVGALFGSSALFASSTPNVTLRNNNLVNNSSTSGAGLAAAYRRGSTTLTTYNAASNNNNFSGSTIFTDGTNTDATFAAYKVRVASRDSNSISEVPVFLSTTGVNPLFLHIDQTVPTQIESGGIPVAGITVDFDGNVRNVTTPDIGADEFTGIPIDLIGPTIAYTPLLNTSSVGDRILTVTITDLSGVPTVGVGLPVIYYRKNADPYASTQCSFVGGNNYDCSIVAAAVGGVTTGDVIGYYVAAQDNAGNVSVSPSGGAAGLTPNPPAAATPPTTPSQYTIVAAISGTFTVDGVGGGAPNFASLTNAGGVFEYINNNEVVGNIVINITVDLAGENGGVALNEFAAPNTILIKPSGAPRTITGSSATSMIKLNGADRVRIDGSTAATFAENVIGGTPGLRELTVTNTGAGAAFWIGTNATGGATNNTIRNLNMVGAGTPAAPSGQGVIAGSGTTFGGAAENGRPNSNNTIRNTTARGVQNAVFTVGDPVTLDQNWVVSENSFGSAVATEKLTFRGIAVQNAQNFTITENIISGISSSTGTSATMSGVLVGGVLNGGVIAKNEIRDIRQNNTVGWGSNGIILNSSSVAANVVVANNFISDIASQGFNGFTFEDNGYGIMVQAGGGYSIYYNSVLMNANQIAAGGHSSGLNVAAGVPAAAIDLRNNIFVSTQTVGNLYGVIINQANAAAFSFIDYNDYWSSTVGFNIGRVNSANQTTLAGWQGATGQDLESLSADPLFTSATDLRTLFGSPVQDQGIAVSVLDDIDGNIRSVVGFAGGTPDMGAKERLGPTSSAASAGGRVMTASGQGIRGAAIVVTGNSLPTPIIVKTGSLGYFQVDGLQTGETYVFTVVSKRFTFSQPSRVINMTDNISDLDFVSDPLE